MSLIEKVEAQVDAEKAKEMEQKLRKASFDLNDYLGSDGTDEKYGWS